MRSYQVLSSQIESIYFQIITCTSYAQVQKEKPVSRLKDEILKKQTDQKRNSHVSQ